MRTTHLISMIALIGVAALAEDPSFPEELSQLNALVGDEAKLVDAVRQFDVLQQALIDWDSDLMAEAGRNSDEEEAKKRSASIEQRRQVLDKAYTVVLAYYPKNARALNYYGEFLYDQRGEIAGAISKWKMAIAEDPKLSLPYNNLGIYYTHTGQYKMGLAAYDKAIELEPDNPDFKYNVAQTYLINRPQVKEEYQWDDKRLYKEAMKLSKQAAELKPTDYELQQDYAVNFFAAENFGVKADWAEAAKAWQTARAQATQLDQVFFTWLNEARAWLQIPNHAKASICLQEALKIVPDSQAAKTLLERTHSGTPSTTN